MGLNRLVHWTLFFLVALAIAGLPSVASAGPAGLPPRPPRPGGGGPDGPDNGLAMIALHISADPNGSSGGAAWSELWTLVQWQDGLTRWNDVDGWQGPPAGMTTDAYHKSWPIEETLFGKGPFRWVVKQGKSGPIIGASSPFSLPHEASEVVNVEVVLTAAGAGVGHGPLTPSINLHVRIGAAAGMWTVVQWGDGLGAWYDIARWQGPLDAINGVDGQKTWPVEQVLLGRGLFRWLVYQGRGGPLAASSDIFYLPGSMSDSVQVDVAAVN